MGVYSTNITCLSAWQFDTSANGAKDHSMSLYIFAEPERPQLFTDGNDVTPLDPVVTTLADNLREAYLKRVGAYHHDLGEPRPSAYPRVQLHGEEPEEVLLDAELYTTLFDLYTVDGWAPIKQLQTTLEQLSKAKSQPDKPAGGTPELKWYTAYTFFIYCRNMLTLLIRESLIDLERRAAIQIIARLSKTAVAVTSAITQEFRITRHTIMVEGVQEVVLYQIENQALIKTLMVAINDAVKQRVAFENLLDQIANIKSQLRQVEEVIAYHRFRGWSPKDADVKDHEWLKATEKHLTDLRDASQSYYDAMKNIVAINCPFALLVIDGLKPDFLKSDLEDLLATAIWGLYERIEGIGKGIDPAQSQISLLIAGLPEDNKSDSSNISLEAVQRLEVPIEGPEATVAAAAINGLNSSPAWFPLLHQMTWRLLLQQGEIGVDSFEYIVMHHYLNAVDDWLNSRAIGEKSTVEFFKTFSQLSAALSVALLVTPLAEIAPALRTASVTADLAIMAYQIDSVTGQLAQLDQVIAQKLLGSEAYAMSSLGQLGELMLVRQEFGNQLTEQLVLELLGIIAAGAWLPVRRLMEARGFFFDIETIIGTDDAGE